MSLIDEIIEKCKEVEKAVSFSATLAGKAKTPEWGEVDQNFTMLKQMSKAAAQKVVNKAEELLALIP